MLLSCAVLLSSLASSARAQDLTGVEVDVRDLPVLFEASRRPGRLRLTEAQIELLVGGS